MRAITTAPAAADPNVPRIITFCQLQERIKRALLDIRLPEGEAPLTDWELRILIRGDKSFAHYYDVHYMPPDGSGLPDNSPLFDFVGKAGAVFAAIFDPSDSRPVTMRQVINIFYEQKILMDKNLPNTIANIKFLSALMLNQRCVIPGRETVIPDRYSVTEYLSNALGKMLLNGEEKRRRIARYVACHPKTALGCIRDMTNAEMDRAIGAAEKLCGSRTETCANQKQKPSFASPDTLLRLRSLGKAVPA